MKNLRFALVLVVAFLFGYNGYADEPAGAVGSAGHLFDKLTAAMLSYQGAIGLVLSVLVAIAKRVSNEKAGLVISKMQAVLDAVPWLLQKLSALVSALCDLLSKAIKSDGWLGKP